METNLWSDSEIVLHWLCSKKQQDSFGSKRTEEIEKMTKQHQWRYCPSASNPADLLSRVVAVDALVDEYSTGGRVLNGCASLQIHGLFGAVPAIMWNLRYTKKAWKPCAWLQGNQAQACSMSLILNVTAL